VKHERDVLPNAGTSNSLGARTLSRRRLITRAAAAAGAVGLLEMGRQAGAQTAARALLSPRESLKITKVETFILRNSWVFVKISTDAGIVGWGEMLKDKSKTCAAGVQQVESYLVGKDPRQVVRHWQAIYRHAFYRGGPVLTAVLSGIDQALWDIKGKALGVPVYELLGGPTRDKIRVYGGSEDVARGRAKAFKMTPRAEGRAAYKYVESPAFVQKVAKDFAAQRERFGPEVDIAIDFHGAVQPQTAALLIKALEPYQPFFIEEPVQCQNVDVLADIARSTHLPIATGERLFTKWGFREVLEKRAASILQPDLSHAGGIHETHIIAGMAEAYYAAVAPHCPLGPIALAACIQLDATIPNFLAQEHSSLGEGYLVQPFVVVDGFVDLPAGPGLGIELDEDAMEDKIDHDWRNPERYHPDDGSVVDW
jgi:galactonate dehydratase